MVNSNDEDFERKNHNDSRDPEERDSEATSKETLSDIEENEAGVDSGGPAPDPGPAPDGAVDDRDEPDDAGRM